MITYNTQLWALHYDCREDEVPAYLGGVFQTKTEMLLGKGIGIRFISSQFAAAVEVELDSTSTRFECKEWVKLVSALGCGAKPPVFRA
jgi:hypothetical protein